MLGTFIERNYRISSWHQGKLHVVLKQFIYIMLLSKSHSQNYRLKGSQHCCSSPSLVVEINSMSRKQRCYGLLRSGQRYLFNFGSVQHIGLILEGFLTSENGTDNLYRNVVMELTTTSCLITEKSAILIYLEAGA